ncbi:MAG: PIN domain nuclease [Chloroflexi bacterium]|nr:PIN domain nuclease [Chloroflexota bacterium]
MSVEFIFRILGMIGFAIGGVFWGKSIGIAASNDPDLAARSVEQYAFIVGSIGALTGLILTPYFTTRPIRAIRSLLTRLSAQSLVSALIGLISGLIIAMLSSFPLSLLPAPFGKILPFFAVLLFGYLGIAVFTMRQADIFSLIPGIRTMAGGVSKEGSTGWADDRTVLLDTSVIIDGRISDITRTGFIPGTLLIPRFVLNELQYIADSADAMRRQRGRRGMEVLAELQKEPTVPVRISDIDVEGMREVDDKLVVLARQLRCPILTNDYNLNRVAELQGVTVLNINELANAVKSILLPGEIMSVRVIQEGREAGQGVAYMDDGTMVVVENGRDYMDKEITIVVTKVLQTAAGRMIFGRPEEMNGNH